MQVSFYINKMTRLQRIVTENCHRELSQRIVTENCHRELSQRIVTENCHRMIQVESISIDSFENPRIVDPLAILSVGL